MDKKFNNAIYLKLIGVTIFILFLYSGIKNIGYPLIWNDESETLMTAESILVNGYPKVHTTNNIIFLPDNKEWTGYKKDIDANISIPWFPYYFSTIPVLLSRLSDDFNTRTLLSRIPFFLMGVLGLLFVIYSIKPFFSDTIFPYIFIFFFLFALLSVPLILNIKEARYYSIVVFLGGALIYLINRFIIFNKELKAIPILLLILTLFLSYQTQYIFFISLIITIGILLGLLFIFRKSNSIKTYFFSDQNLKKNFILIGIVLFTLIVMILPFYFFYDMYNIAIAANNFYKPSAQTYQIHFNKIFDFLLNQDFLILALLTKTLFYFSYFTLKPKEKTKYLQLDNIFLSSIFSLIFIVVFILMLCRMPFLFTRHFILLQPLLTIGMALDFFGFIYYSNGTKNATIAKVSFISIFFIIFLFNLPKKMPFIKGHLAEMSKPVKGPLDYLIPAIKTKYGNTKNIVIATNYEELTYLFYLNCRVILGYNYKNIESDIKETPDVLIYRKNWGHGVEPFNIFLQKAKYEKESFEVFDSRVNNITELNWFFENHKFKTKFANADFEKTDLYYLSK